MDSQKQVIKEISLKSALTVSSSVESPYALHVEEESYGLTEKLGSINVQGLWTTINLKTVTNYLQFHKLYASLGNYLELIFEVKNFI